WPRSRALSRCPRVRRGSARRTPSERWATTSSRRGIWRHSASRSGRPASTTSRSCRGCCAGCTCPTSSRSWPRCTSSSGTSTDEFDHLRFASATRSVPPAPWRSRVGSPDGAPMIAADVPYWAQSLLRVLGGTVAVLLPAGTIVYLFLFKMMSFMQSRLGPMEAGPYGSMQLFAEVGKWLQKEDIQPKKADKQIFKLAPLIVLVSTFLLVAVVPFGPDAYFTNFDAGVFYMLAVSSISTLGILISACSMPNKSSLLGGRRAAGQLIAYELPMVLAVLGVVIQAGTMSLNGIVFSQADGTIFGWSGIGNPFLLTQFVGFVIFIAAVQAEL